MTTLSVRDVADRHLDRRGDLSVDEDLYGYVHRDDAGRRFGTLDPDVDVLPGSGTRDAPTTRSLKRHLQTVSGVAVDVVLVLVAHEPDYSGAVSLAEAQEIQYAVQVARDLYAQVDLGIRRLEWDRIPEDDAGGFADITSIFGAIGLTASFSGRAGAVDVFIVQTMAGLTGRSPNPGPCDKGPKEGLMTGCVVELAADRWWDTAQMRGIAIAHELGHYLGLGHESDPTNLMCGPVLFDGCDPSEAMTELTASQGTEMKRHCLVVDGR